MELIMNSLYADDYCNYCDPNSSDFWVDTYLDDSTGVTYIHRVWDRDRVIPIYNKIVLDFITIEAFNLIKGRMKKLKVKIR